MDQNAGGSDMSVDQAVADWNTYMQPYAGEIPFVRVC